VNVATSARILFRRSSDHSSLSCRMRLNSSRMASEMASSILPSRARFRSSCGFPYQFRPLTQMFESAVALSTYRPRCSARHS
jgi:hypothetical protein